MRMLKHRFDELMEEKHIGKLSLAVLDTALNIRGRVFGQTIIIGRKSILFTPSW